MVIAQGRQPFRLKNREIEARVSVYGSRSEILADLDEQLQTDPTKELFIRDLPMHFSEGRLDRTSKSSLGMDVPSLSRELWELKDATFADTIELVIGHIQRPYSPTGEEAPGVKALDAAALLGFLCQPKHATSLRLWVVGLWSYQFRARKWGAQVPVDLVNEFMVFSRDSFGSFASPKIWKDYQATYRRTGFIEVGYLGQEESH